MDQNTSRKIQVKVIKLQQQLEDINLGLLKLKIRYFNDDKVLNSQEDNIYTLDYSPELIRVLEQHRDHLSNASERVASFDVEYDQEEVSPNIKVVESYRDVYDFSRRFLDPAHSINRGVCKLKTSCMQANENHQPGALLLDFPCMNKTCPLNEESKNQCLFIPSEDHHKQLKKLRKVIREYLKAFDVVVLIELDDNENDLHKIDWKIIETLIPDRKNNIFVVKSLAHEDSNNEHITQEIENFYLNQYNKSTPFKILIIYLNQLHKKEEEWDQFVEDSQTRWNSVFHNNNRGWTELFFLKSPTRDELRTQLDGSYHMIIFVGHGPTESYINLKGQENEQQVHVDFLCDLLSDTKNLEIVCFLSCNSDELARKLHRMKKVGLVIAFQHLLEYTIIPEFEKSLQYRMTNYQGQKITWLSIFHRVLADINTQANIRTISLNSIVLYLNPQLPLIFQNRTNYQPLDNNSEEKEDPSKSILQRFKSFFITNKKTVFFLTLLVLLLIGLAGILYWSNREKKASDNIPKPQNQTSEVIIEGLIYLSKSNGLSPRGGVIIGKNGNEYYAITKYNYGDELRDFEIGWGTKNKLKVKKVLSIKNHRNWSNNWKVISFQLLEYDINIPKFNLDESSFHRPRRGQEMEIWGHNNEGERNEDTRYIKIDETEETEESLKHEFGLEYTHQENNNIGDEFAGSAIVKESQCIVGIHIRKKPNSSILYEGEEFDDIHKVLKESGNLELEAIANKMEPCS